MADVVLGLATNHGPTASLPAESWAARAEYDRKQLLVGPDGEFRSYDEMLAQADPAIADELNVESFRAKQSAAAKASARLEKVMVEAKPDIAVIIGNDHHNMLFNDTCVPTFAVFTGEEVICYPLEWLDETSKEVAAMHFGDRVESYPCAPDLAGHILESLVEDDFDPARFSAQGDGCTIGEAYIYVRNRLMKPAGVPLMVPIVINAFFPPNLPSPRRSYDFGRAVREAIDSWDDDRRVAIIASAGLSHFLVDEELDRMVLDAVAGGDPDVIAKLPAKRMQGGNAEARSWLAMAGAMHDHEMVLVDYVTARRSPAGTGGGMGFAYWEKSADRAAAAA